MIIISLCLREPNDFNVIMPNGNLVVVPHHRRRQVAAAPRRPLASGHHFAHFAAGYHFHHFAGLVELFQQAVNILYGCAATFGDSRAT